eukprot:s2791_g10.t1
MSAAEMRVLRGRLVFAEAQIYGRLAGVHMQESNRWEHAVGESQIDEDLRDSLLFLRDRIVLGGPRRVLADHGRVFHLYTDACYAGGVGGLGGILYDGHGKMLSFFSTEVNREQVQILNPSKKETVIFELEALAVLVGLEKEGGGAMLVLVVAGERTGAIFETAVAKGANMLLTVALKVSRSAGDKGEFFKHTVNHPSIKALAEAIASRWSKETQIQMVPKESHRPNGAVERAISEVSRQGRTMVRTMEYDIQSSY